MATVIVRETISRTGMKKRLGSRRSERPSRLVKDMFDAEDTAMTDDYLMSIRNTPPLGVDSDKTPVLQHSSAPTLCSPGSEDEDENEMDKEDVVMRNPAPMGRVHARTGVTWLHLLQKLASPPPRAHRTGQWRDRRRARFQEVQK